MGLGKHVGTTLGLLLLAFAPDARAQVGIPSVGGLSGLAGGAAPIAAPIGGVPAVATAVPTSSPTTLWSFLGITPQNCAACKQKLCASQFGQLLNNGLTGPIGGLAGGLIPALCPPNLSTMGAGDGAQGTASQIQAAMAEAKAKIAAIEYLATVDCGIWPEAETALIKALRNERVECVRFAAARALGTGCCCTEKTAAALTNVLEGSTEDGGIFERSERVKSASYMALCRCVNKYIPKPPKRRPEVPEGPRRPESPPEPPAPGLPGRRSTTTAGDANIRLTEYYDHIEHLPSEQILERARLAIARSVNAPWGDQILPTGSRSLYHAVAKASGTALKPNPGAPGDRAPLIASAAPVLNPVPPKPVLHLIHEQAAATPTPPHALTSAPINASGIEDATPPPPPIPRSFPPPDPAPDSIAPPIPRTFPLPVPAAPIPATAPVSSALPARKAPRPAGERGLFGIFTAARRP